MHLGKQKANSLATISHLYIGPKGLIPVKLWDILWLSLFFFHTTKAVVTVYPSQHPTKSCSRSQSLPSTVGNRTCAYTGYLFWIDLIANIVVGILYIEQRPDHRWLCQQRDTTNLVFAIQEITLDERSTLWELWTLVTRSKHYWNRTIMETQFFQFKSQHWSCYCSTLE